LDSFARDSLLSLEVLILDTGLVYFDPLNHLDPLFRRKEPSRRGRVGKEEPDIILRKEHRIRSRKDQPENDSDS
jgi:hypothetical protein